MLFLLFFLGRLYLCKMLCFLNKQKCIQFHFSIFQDRNEFPISKYMKKLYEIDNLILFKNLSIALSPSYFVDQFCFVIRFLLIGIRKLPVY